MIPWEGSPELNDEAKESRNQSEVDGEHLSLYRTVNEIGQKKSLSKKRDSI